MILFGQTTSTSKRHPKPIKSPGGKDAWIPTLLAMVPTHKIYVEPYAGGASLFYAKAPAEESVLSDVDPDIVAVHQFLKSATDEDLEWFRKQDWTGSAAKYKATLAQSGGSLRRRAYRFKYLNFWSRRGRIGDFDPVRARGYQGPPLRSFLARLKKFRAHLKDTTVLRGDALAVMRRFDGAGTFHYVDPPWKPEGKGEQWKGFDAAALGKVLGALRGKVLVSYQGELPLPDSFRKRRITISQDGLRETSSAQWIAWNYDARAKASKAVWPLDLNQEPEQL